MAEHQVVGILTKKVIDTFGLSFVMDNEKVRKYKQKNAFKFY